jgi:hypothetical protein
MQSAGKMILPALRLKIAVIFKSTSSYGSHDR